MFDIAASLPGDEYWWRTLRSPHPGCATLELRVLRGNTVYPCDLTAPVGERACWVVCSGGSTSYPTPQSAQAGLFHYGFVPLPRPDARLATALARMYYLTGAEAQGWLWLAVYHYLRIVKRDWRGTRITTDEATEGADAICEMFAKKERAYDEATGAAAPGAPQACKRCEPFLSVVMLERDHAHGVEIPAALDQARAAERERDALLAEVQTLRQEKEERERADTTRAHRVTELAERMTKAEEERDQARREIAEHRKEGKAEWFADRAEQARMREALRADDPRCELCNKPATCFGRYSGMEASALHCDDCCLHGCEDGHCDLLGVAKLRAEHDKADLTRAHRETELERLNEAEVAIYRARPDDREVPAPGVAASTTSALSAASREALGRLAFETHTPESSWAEFAEATKERYRRIAEAVAEAAQGEALAIVRALADLHPPVAHNPWTTQARRLIEQARTLLGWPPAQVSHDVVTGLNTDYTGPRQCAAEPPADAIEAKR